MAIGTGTAILGSAVLGAASSRSAARSQSRAADRAAQLQQQQFERQIELQEPWRQAGINALGRMGTGFTGQVDLTQDPGYAFRLEQGQKALERSAAARGGLISGNTGGALQQFGQGLASQEYQNAYNRALTQYNTTAALAGIGQTATNQLGAAGQNYAMNAGNAYGAGAQARASGYMGSANAIAGGIGQYAGYQQNQATNSLLQQALGRGGGGGGGRLSFGSGSGTFGEGEY
jgi:hypothetical protein